MRRWQNPVDFFAPSRRPVQRRRNPAAEYRVVAVDPSSGMELVSVFIVASSASEAENEAAMRFGTMGLWFAGYQKLVPTGAGRFDLYLYFRPQPVVAAPPPPPPPPPAPASEPPAPAARKPRASKPREKKTFVSPVEYIAPPAAPSPPPERTPSLTVTPAAVSPTAPAHVESELEADDDFEVKPYGGRTWSPFQIGIFRDVARGRGHTQVIARAGSGKTTTLVAALDYIPPGKKTLMVAFGKKIADELRTRVPPGVDAATLNSFGNLVTVRAFPRLPRSVVKDKAVYAAIDNIKADPAGEEVLRQAQKKGIPAESALWVVGNAIAKAVELAKATLSTTPDSLDRALDMYEYDTPALLSREDFIRLAIKTVETTTADTNRIDYSDQVWFPHAYDLGTPQYDFVFIDEAQDLNKAQIELALKAVKPGGRIISVGDPAQSIYQFRGADKEAIPNIVARLGAKILPLSVTYRCAKSIVREANQYVPDLQATPDAPEGVVGSIDKSQLLEAVRPGDFILSRLNAPMIGICFALLKMGVRANIAGKKVGEQLIKLVNESAARDVPTLVEWIGQWEEREVARLEARKRDTTAVVDKAECLFELCSGVSSINELKVRIDKLFSEYVDENKVVLSSVHQAKGLERDRVFLLRSTFRPGEKQEETNLMYVAITRARKELYYVEGSWRADGK